MKLKVKNLRQMLTFMEERQRVHNKREAGEPYPWTKDPILSQWRFCNVYREDDKETRWLRENWLQLYANHSNLWFAICMFRQLNWSPTLAEIGFPEEWNPRRVLKILQVRKDRGDKVYTSAYLIPSRGEKSKIDYTVKRVLDPLWKAAQKEKTFPPWKTSLLGGGTAEYQSGPNLEGSHRWLTQFYGWGPFLSYEAVTDLRHTRYLCNANDVQTWANPGPGAKRGICRILGIGIRESIRREDQIEYMREELAWFTANRDPAILPTLEMRDIEHSNCEWDKMCRAKERIAAGKTVGLERFRPPVKSLV